MRLAEQPMPQTPNPKPHTPNPKPQTPNPFAPIYFREYPYYNTIMKICLIVLACLIALSICAAVEPQTAMASCKNPFSGTLIGQGVAVSDTPKVGQFDHCQAEWNTHGNCCEPKSLVKAFDDDNKTIANSASALQNTVKTIKVLLDAVLIDGKDTDSNIDDLPLQFIEDKKARMEMIRNLSQATFFTTISGSSDVCWNYMVKIRGSALCQICSGRSNTFFRDNMALISEDTCQEAVSKCKGFFKDLKAFVEDFKKVHDLIATQTEDIEILKKFTEVNEALKDTSPPDSLIEDFTLLEYANQNDKSALLANVCSRFVNMRRPTVITRLDFVGRLSSAVGAIGHTLQLYISRATYMQTKAVAHWKNRLEQTGASIGSCKTSIKCIAQKMPVLMRLAADIGKLIIKTSKIFGEKIILFTELIKAIKGHVAQIFGVGRTLVSLQQDTNPFQSDSIMMRKQDSMFTSYDGIKGSTLDNQYSDKKPMDINMDFP